MHYHILTLPESGFHLEWREEGSQGKWLKRWVWRVLQGDTSHPFQD